MTESAFDAKDWIGRLGASLDALAAEVTFSFSLDVGQGPYVTIDRIRAVREGADYSSGIGETKVPSGVQWSGNLALDEPRAILREHRQLRRSLKGVGEDEGLLFPFPDQGGVVPSRNLVLRLLKRTAISTGRDTARLLLR